MSQDMNKNQKMAVNTINGPVLITAGPGTGKTFVLIRRTLNLIINHDINPENIMITTFTEKAAKELITRLSNELARKKIKVNINDMYIGTFHSICLRIIKENLDYTNIKKNYKTLDTFDQQYIVYQNISKFNDNKYINQYFTNLQENRTLTSWEKAENICFYINKIQEELIDFNDLKKDKDKNIKAIGCMLEIYNSIISKENYMDFSSILVEAYKIISENKEVLNKLQNQLQYIMVDEYQDTNYVQEQIIFLIGKKYKNICVVGDDDQGLYRFRGATIRNILEFPKKFKKNPCKIIKLDKNYRSHKDIVDFYNKWMSTPQNFVWDKYRYEKNIIANNQEKLQSKSVVRLDDNTVDGWHNKILQFINKLKKSKKISDYNQIAFLFKSVKKDTVKDLIDFLENNDINVYSPRSDMFFARSEIKLLVGILLILFPTYTEYINQNKYLSRDMHNYYNECLGDIKEFFNKKDNILIKKWCIGKSKYHCNLNKNTDYNISGLIYQLFQFDYFKKILNYNYDNIIDSRSIRNLSLFTQLAGKFEYLYNLDVFTKKNIDYVIGSFFDIYLKFLYRGGISEYEDDSEYAPRGCVSFLTIHQAKGMEFPIVFVDSLGNIPRQNNSEIMIDIENRFFKRKSYEPDDQIKYFDFYRLYYTAFSRAQDLLILTCKTAQRTPSLYFREFYNSLDKADSKKFNINDFTFHTVKPVNLSLTFSYTSHILVYETCSLQYKFYKELEFTPVRAGAMIFGMLVHSTIEDIHKAAIRGDVAQITQENIVKWFNNNYNSISKAEKSYLAEPQKQAALQQILRYVEQQNRKWNKIKEAEVEISMIKDEYILTGKVDLIRGKDNTLEIIDFKAEKKPDINSADERLEQYKRQLYLYGYLIENKLNMKVSKMHLHYTGEENGVPTITYNYDKTESFKMIDTIDKTVQNILNKNYKVKSKDKNTCSNCDFRFYCNKNEG